jgi:hypothetical protein
MQSTMVGLWCGADLDAQALYDTEGAYRGARALHGTDGLVARMGRGADIDAIL